MNFDNNNNKKMAHMGGVRYMQALAVVVQVLFSEKLVEELQAKKALLKSIVKVRKQGEG